MLKTLLKQLILEECIDTLFNNIKHNFTTLIEKVYTVSYKLTETHYVFLVDYNYKGIKRSYYKDYPKPLKPKDYDKITKSLEEAFLYNKTPEEQLNILTYTFQRSK